MRARNKRWKPGGIALSQVPVFLHHQRGAGWHEEKHENTLLYFWRMFNFEEYKNIFYFYFLLYRYIQ